MLEKEVAQDTAREAAIEKRRIKKQASDKIRTSAIYKKKRESDAREAAATENRQKKKKASDKIRTSSAREAAAKNKSDAREAAMDKRFINIHGKIKTAFLNKKKKESDARESVLWYIQ